MQTINLLDCNERISTKRLENERCQIVSRIRSRSWTKINAKNLIRCRYPIDMRTENMSRRFSSGTRNVGILEVKFLFLRILTTLPVFGTRYNDGELVVSKCRAHGWRSRIEEASAANSQTLFKNRKLRPRGPQALTVTWTPFISRLMSRPLERYS